MRSATRVAGAAAHDDDAAAHADDFARERAAEAVARHPHDLDLAAHHARSRPTGRHCREWSGCRRVISRPAWAPTSPSTTISPPVIACADLIEPVARVLDADLRHVPHAQPEHIADTSPACASSAARSCRSRPRSCGPAGAAPAATGRAADRDARRIVRTSGFTAADPADDSGAARACRRNCRRRRAPRRVSARAARSPRDPARMAAATASDVNPSITISSTEPMSSSSAVLTAPRSVGQ